MLCRGLARIVLASPGSTGRTLQEDDVETISCDELARALRAGGDVRLVCTLGAWGFGTGHLPGSLSLPTPEHSPESCSTPTPTSSSTAATSTTQPHTRRRTT